MFRFLIQPTSLFEESLGDFTWSLSDVNTLVRVIQNNKVSHESIHIIDNNTVLLNGQKYIRRGSKNSSDGNHKKPSPNSTQGGHSANRGQSNTRNSNATQHTSSMRSSNPLIVARVNQSDDFFEMYKNLIGFPFDFRDSNISDIKSYCRRNGYIFTGKDYYIDVSNPVTEVFGQKFEVRIHERDGTANGVGKPSRMYLEWYSKLYPSTAQMNSDFMNFTDEIVKAGGVFKGYDETCQRSIYLFPNGIEIRTKAWEHNKRIQMFVYLP